MISRNGTPRTSRATGATGTRKSRLSLLLRVSRKDWSEIRNNKQLFAPMLVLPILLVVVMPIFMVIVPIYTMTPADLAEFNQLVPGLQGYEAFIQYNNMFIFFPMFTLIPILTTAIIASDSWAGEKERKTAESLLLLPLTDQELFLAKVLSSLIPGILITWGCGVAYMAMVDVVALPFVGYLVLPNLDWFYTMFLLSPILSFFSVFITVWVSIRAKDTKSAYQTGGVTSMLFLGFMFGGIFGLYTLVTFIVTLILGIVDVVFILISPRLFSREKIISHF